MRFVSARLLQRGGHKLAFPLAALLAVEPLSQTFSSTPQPTFFAVQKRGQIYFLLE